MVAYFSQLLPIKQCTIKMYEVESALTHTNRLLSSLLNLTIDKCGNIV